MLEPSQYSLVTLDHVLDTRIHNGVLRCQQTDNRNASADIHRKLGQRRCLGQHYAYTVYTSNAWHILHNMCQNVYHFDAFECKARDGLEIVFDEGTLGTCKYHFSSRA